MIERGGEHYADLQVSTEEYRTQYMSKRNNGSSKTDL
jgi:hypothetical protein